MKKLKVLTVALFAFLAMGIGTSFASEKPVKENSDLDEVKARCEIQYKGFYGKGNCKKVLEALARYKEIAKG